MLIFSRRFIFYFSLFWRGIPIDIFILDMSGHVYRPQPPPAPISCVSICMIPI